MTTEASIAVAAPITSWRSGLTVQHWRVLWGSYLGWIFDGYEAFALIVALPPALHSLLTPEFRRDTLALCASFFFCLLSVYIGINWVPSMLVGAGFDVGTAS